MEVKRELLKMIRELSYEKREVTLASGLKSDFYIDMRVTLLHPRGVQLAAQLMCENLRSLDGKLRGVGGMTMGADPIVTGVSLSSQIQGWKQPLLALYIRKEPKGHGLGQWCEGLKNFKKGDRIFILEDTVTTGGSSLKAVDKAREAGLEVQGVFTCVDREEGAREKIEAGGLEFRTLITKSDILQA
ncbi:MAG TPA: orotate phosphoribosyltransferase [Bdellovibrionales bacterium]|nr:orotate phosphoribosyltransferase [Bdellovibrionales bacterium]